MSESVAGGEGFITGLIGVLFVLLVVIGSTAGVTETVDYGGPGACGCGYGGGYW